MLRGERDGNLGALEGRRWDYCIDTCGYVPRIVEQSAQLLSASVGHYLVERDVGPRMELPLWIPESEKDMAGFQQRNIDKALAAGLKTRALADTPQSTLAWLAQRPVDYQCKAGMAADKERELLADLKK
ncbi:MAG: hypothetical protein ACI906_001354 [Candidatus Latescibacterota bacterium]|jgi:hypothetical protein